MISIGNENKHQQLFIQFKKKIDLDHANATERINIMEHDYEALSKLTNDGAKPEGEKKDRVSEK